MKLHPAVERDLTKHLGHPPPFSREELDGVRQVTVSDGEGSVEIPDPLPKLLTLRYRRWSGLALPSLAPWPRLMAVEIDTADLRSIEEVRGHPRLDTVSLTGCCVEDLRPLLDVPRLERVVLDALPLDEHSYRQVLDQLQKKGVTLIGVERNLPEIAWRMMRKLAERGLRISVIVDDFGETRLYAPGKDFTVESVAVIDEGELDQLLAAHPKADTAAFMEQARAVFHARLGGR